MKKYLQILKVCPLFCGLSDEKLINALGCLDARILEFGKNSTIYAEGTPAKYIGIMLSGSAKVFQNDYYGNSSVLGNILPSEMFAEAFACAESESIPVTVTANEKSEVMLIDCNRILNTCNNNCAFHRQLIFNLMKAIAQKTVMFYQKIQIISKRTTRDKLLAFLSLQAKRAGSNSFYIPFDRQQLADYLEVERSGLSSTIGKLIKEGVITSSKRYFELKKLDYFNED